VSNTLKLLSEMHILTKSSSSGGALRTSPSSGWDSDDLATIFEQTVPRDTYNTSENSGTTNPPSPTPSPSGKGDTSSSLSAGAIAGIVVGIIALLALTSATVFFCRKRTRGHSAPTVGAKSAFNSMMWHKPELDGSVPAARYELATGNPPELHGDDLTVHEMSADGNYVGGVNGQYREQAPLAKGAFYSDSSR
jgi:hypothetical protein